MPLNPEQQKMADETQAALAAKTAPVEVVSDDPSDVFAKMKADVDAHLAKKGEAPPTKPAAEVPPVVAEPASGTPSPAPVSSPIPNGLKQRALAAGWDESEIGDDPKALERAVAKVEQREAAWLRRAAQVAKPQGPAEKTPEKPPEPTVAELWAKEREHYNEAERGFLDKLVAAHTDALGKIEELRGQVEPVKSWAEHQHREQQATHLTNICDAVAAAGYEAHVGKGRPKPGTEAYRNHGLIGHLVAADMRTYAELGRPMDMDEMKEAAIAHAARLFGKQAPPAAKVDTAPPVVPPPPENHARPVPPKDPVTGKFVPTERPSNRDREEMKEKGFNYAVDRLKKRQAAATVMGLENGYLGGDIHDQP